MDKARYTNLKEKHNDCIILENEGCFLTSWFDDAKLVAEVLHLTVTTVGADRAICTFPIGALDSYLPKLIRSGCKVVIV